MFLTNLWEKINLISDNLSMLSRLAKNFNASLFLHSGLDQLMRHSALKKY